MKLTDIVNEEYKDIRHDTADSIKMKGSLTNEKITKMYASFLKTIDEKNCGIRGLEDYKTARDLLLDEKILYEPEDITLFCFVLQEYQENEYFNASGLFLSALINVHYEQTTFKGEYLLHLGFSDNEDTEIDCLGIKNAGAHIHVVGNVGYFLGEKMERGTIQVDGNASCNLGNLMFGGEVYIKNAGKKVGRLMARGSIFADEIESIDESFKSGKIVSKKKIEGFDIRKLESVASYAEIYSAGEQINARNTFWDKK